MARQVRTEKRKSGFRRVHLSGSRVNVPHRSPLIQYVLPDADGNPSSTDSLRVRLANSIELRTDSLGTVQ
jgi:hypothetical protein